ncbi:MAG: AAA family ATPase [Proteobacteria bacterium]|nr:AAA family ATPase [Pseudomonadota bacterium]MBU4297355.1 AAA family ATPase [Pseudomonadota bacterium]MCG2748946.1 AAA family ATPase [Desulfobulbaceae bacterium]
MYEKFYGLSEKPFHIVPNPHFLYLSAKHQHALTYLEYGIREGMGFILLTGEIGTGKTTLIRHMLNQIEAEIEVAVIFNTNVSANQLLSLILQEFELEADGTDKARNLDRIYQFLIQKYAKRSRVLLIIDEAQNLSDEVLEEVRMLSNLQADDTLLLQIMLVGQPELKAKLKRPGLAQLTQRIAVNYHLMPLNREETGIYIASRLEKVGGDPELFSPEAIDEIYRASNGTPRSINLLCDSALVYGFADELQKIDKDILLQVLEDKGDFAWAMEASAAAAPLLELGGAAGAEFAELVQRLATVERQVQELRFQLTLQQDELEKHGEGFKDEIVRQLTSQLEQERKKSGKLLLEYGRVKERVKWLEGSSSLPAAAGTDEPHEGRQSVSDKKTKKTSWFSFRF